MKSDLTYVRDSDGVCNFLGFQVPKTQCVSTTNSRAGLQNTDGLHKVRCQNELLLPVDGQPVRGELLIQDVEDSWDILGPLVNDIKLVVGLDKTTRRSAQG